MMKVKLNWCKASRREARLRPRRCMFPAKSFSRFNMFPAPVTHFVFSEHTFSIISTL